MAEALNEVVGEQIYNNKDTGNLEKECSSTIFDNEPCLGLAQSVDDNRFSTTGWTNDHCSVPCQHCLVHLYHFVNLKYNPLCHPV